MVLRLFNDENLVISKFLRIFALDFRLDLDNFTAQPTQIGKILRLVCGIFKDGKFELIKYKLMSTEFVIGTAVSAIFIIDIDYVITYF
jgi:hypothetical protein